MKFRCKQHPLSAQLHHKFQHHLQLLRRSWRWAKIGYWTQQNERMIAAIDQNIGRHCWRKMSKKKKKRFIACMSNGNAKTHWNGLCVHFLGKQRGTGPKATSVHGFSMLLSFFCVGGTGSATIFHDDQWQCQNPRQAQDYSVSTSIDYVLSLSPLAKKQWPQVVPLQYTTYNEHSMNYEHLQPFHMWVSSSFWILSRVVTACHSVSAGWWKTWGPAPEIHRRSAPPMPIPLHRSVGCVVLHGVQ